MVVGSCNYLNSSAERKTLELGIRVYADDADANEGPLADARPGVPSAISDVLRWARSLVPDYRLRQGLADDPVLFGRGSSVRSVPVTTSVLEADWTDSRLSVPFWRSAWERRLDERLRQLS